ncbi:MAG: DinB family protein [SAR202 cluster bacterium]|nr:DinB family protein [SAR202 cluster bacterium]
MIDLRLNHLYARSNKSRGALMGVGTISNAVYDRIGGVLERALTGLTYEQLTTQPAGRESNPIGWIAWHLIRTQDHNYSILADKASLWIENEWHKQFNLPQDRGTGNGDSLDQVRSFDPISSELLLSYHKAARERSREYLENLSEEDLDRPSPESMRERDQVVKVTIARVTGDLMQHIGQIAYIRGLVDEHGWYGA